MIDIKNISLVNENDCCGCMACVNACPTSGIEIKEDACGFLYPSVNVETCINCGKCLRSCSVKNIKKNAIENQEVYCALAKNPDVKRRGSSGGIFETIASKFIADGGVAYGAVMDTDMKVRHKRADSYDSLLPLLKSKYL